MSFAQPVWLLLLGVAAALAIAYLLVQRRRTRYAVRFATLPMLEKVAPKGPGWRRHVPAVAFLLAIAFLALAIARPMMDVRVPRERATILLAIDTSLSMEATDVSPSRIEVAKRAAVEFVEGLPDQFEVGLVSFAGQAAVISAPTVDRAAVVSGIEALTLDERTAIGEAVFTSLASIEGARQQVDGDQPPARIVLLSDGANTAGRSLDDAAAAATQAAVPVSTIAYGTAEGTVMQGAVSMPVPVDSDALQELAEGTGGTFATAESDTELQGVYGELESAISWRTEHREITTLVAALALVAAAVAGLTSLVWFARLP